jgi:hypothetical protein
MASTSVYVRDYRKEVPGKLSDDRKQWDFPPIESTNSHGKKMFWRIYVRCITEAALVGKTAKTVDEFSIIDDSYFDSKPLEGIFGWTSVDSGIEGGKIKDNVPTITRNGKNAGKVSATNAWTQALRDAYGIYNKQLRKSNNNGNTVNNNNTVNAGAKKQAITLYPPMLAQVLKAQKVQPRITADSPAYVQRKYNGVRTVATLDKNSVILYSRRKNVYPGFGYLKEELLPILRAYWESGRKLYLDGEIYKHGEPLQNISGNARREDQTEKYEYMIYDCFVADEPGLKYSERRAILDEIFGEFDTTYAQNVETFVATSMDEVNQYYAIFLEEEYEGAMIRLDETYHFSYNERHSKVLLKMKPTLDEEYEIVGWETGTKGKAAEAIMMICVVRGQTDNTVNGNTVNGNTVNGNTITDTTVNDKKFPVTPAMEIPDRIALAKKMSVVEPNGKTHFENHWLGKKLIVYFDEKSKDNVPQRARTKMELRTWD